MQLGLALILAVVHECAGVDVLTNAAWELQIGCDSDSSPATGSDGTVYFGDWKGRLWAVRPDGTRRWAYVTANEIKSSPAVGGDGSIYFGSRDRNFYALDPNGRLRWKYRTGGWVDSSPALATNGAIYFGSWDGNVYALSSAGAKQWVFKTGGPVVSSPAIGRDGTIYFGSHDRALYALTPAGTKLWKYVTGGAILSSAALGPDGAVYFTSVDGYLYALNPDGTLQWRLHTAGVTESSPVVSPEGNLYVGVNQHLWNVSARGVKLWQRLEGDTFEATPMILSDTTVCFVSRYGTLNTILRDDGRWDDVNLKWAFYLYRSGHASPGIGADGTIYTSGRWTFFLALPVKAQLAQSSWPKFRGNARNTGNWADTGGQP